MSNTFTRKIHRGEIQKKINQEENKKRLEAENEAIEAEKWKEGAKKVTGHDIKVEKEEDKKKHKEKLREMYENELKDA